MTNVARCLLCAMVLLGASIFCASQTGYGSLGYGLGPYGGTGLPATVLTIKGGQWGMAGSMVGSFSIAQSPAAAPLIPCGPVLPAPQLPQIFADDREVDPPGAYDVTVTMGVAPYTANAAGLNKAILDWYNAPDQWWHVIVPHGTLGTTTPLPVTSKVSLLGKVGATKFMVFDSDTPLPEKVTVCSHKIVDNSDGSSPRNYQCTNDKGSMGAIEGQWNSGNNGMLFQACQVGVDPNCTVGPNHYAFKNLELRFQAGNHYSNQGVKIINLDDGDQTGTNGESHIWFKGNYLHGDAPDINPGTAMNNTSTIIGWTGCSFCGAAFNYVDQVVSLNSESHIFTGIWSNGPMKFAHNWIEGSSIPLFFGGAGATVVPYENVFDVQVTGNRFTHPPLWMPLSGASLIALKSSGEVKTCSRCWFDGNIWEYSNTSGGQKGQCFTLTARNTSGGALGDNYLNSINDITISNFLCRHAVTGFETGARSGGSGNGGGAAQPARRWSITNGLLYDISPGTGTIYNNTSNIPFVTEIGAGGNAWTCNAARDAAGLTSLLLCADGLVIISSTRTAGVVTATLSVPATFNTSPAQTISVINSSNPSFNCTNCVATSVTNGNLTVKYPAAGPNGSSFGGQIIVPGLHETTMSVGDLVDVQGCADASFNTGTHGAGFASQGPPALAGTQSYILVSGSPVPGPVYYSNVGAPLASTTGCIVSNEQGFQQAFSARHLTIVGGFVGSSGGKSQIPSCLVHEIYALNFTFQDNLVAPNPSQYAGLNCQGGTNTEGSSSEINMADAATLTLNHNAFVGRSAANYTDYPGATNPSTGNWFPVTPWCAVGTVDFTTCFAFNNMMNTTTYQPNDPDYHGYALNSSSVFKAGGSQQASDGTAVGADISVIDTHLNAMQAICPVVGGSGPFPD